MTIWKMTPMRKNSNSMKEKITKRLNESASVHNQIATDLAFIELFATISKTITDSLKKGGKVLLCGNGGSAADAQHIAAEFVNRFYLNRSPYAAIALTTDTSVITSIANDFSYEEIFSKQIEAFGKKDDILIAISTSGTAANVNLAVKVANNLGLKTISFTGKDGGKLKDLCDINFIVPSTDTPRIQEIHILAAHIICEIVEEDLTCTEK